MTKLRWGLVGASTIAAQHMIEAFRVNGGEVVAVMSTSSHRAARFAHEHRIWRARQRGLEELVEFEGHRCGLHIDDQ